MIPLSENTFGIRYKTFKREGEKGKREKGKKKESIKQELTLLPLSCHPGCSHGHLPQGDGAVVGGRQGVGERLEA